MLIVNNDFICTYHKIITVNAKKLMKKYLEDEETKQLISEILLSAKYATKAGKRMEIRLYNYFDSIERLGFKRVRKKRK